MNSKAVFAFMVTVPGKTLFKPSISSTQAKTARPTMTLTKRAPRTKRAERGRDAAVESDEVGAMAAVAEPNRKSPKARGMSNGWISSS